LVLLILDDQMDMPIWKGAANAFGQFLQQMDWRCVDDRVHGIEAQAVEMKLADPIKRVLLTIDTQLGIKVLSS
jgi:hypothetical protein